MKMKLLSPAGDMESLKAAVYNGADEVYLGISGFNARNNIQGFNLKTLKDAVDFAHVYGVKIHLAINILFADSEINDALSTIIQAYNMGVDAFIIQDLGLAHLLHKHYPEIEIHASTQMGIHNLEGAKFISQFGFKRIVLARETSIEEIKNIKTHLNIELEYFAQGALCVSFSGNCYLSSYLCDASGNRGKCKQLCRLPYTLMFKNKKLKEGYLLSAKDFNMLDRLKDLQSAGIDAIKIEGRARRPFYVAATTKVYRNALDSIPYDKNLLSLAFTRQFTEGYFNGNNNIISNYNNHIGIKIGEIKKVNKGKRFNEVMFTSNFDISPKSTFKIFDNEKEVCTFTAFSIKKINKNTYSTTTTQNVPMKGIIHLIIDDKTEKDILMVKKKLPLKINIVAKQNTPLKAFTIINKKTISIDGDICNIAEKQPLSENDFITCFDKSEYFTPVLDLNLDSIFLTKQQLNKFRRSFYDKVYTELIKINKKPLSQVSINLSRKTNPFLDFKYVDSYKTLPKQKNIIYSPELYNIEDINKFIETCKVNNKTPILDTPNFITSQDWKFLENIINELNIQIIANNYGALSLTNNFIAGPALNIYNSLSADIINKPFITAEHDFGSKVYAPYMTLRHCPVKEHTNCNCANCKYNSDYAYKMQSGEMLMLKRKKLTSCTFYLTKE